MNPVLDVVEAGHYQHSVGRNGQMPVLECRVCNDPWPCPMVLAARAEHRARTLSGRGAE